MSYNITVGVAFAAVDAFKEEAGDPAGFSRFDLVGVCGDSYAGMIGLVTWYLKYCGFGFVGDALCQHHINGGCYFKRHWVALYADYICAVPFHQAGVIGWDEAWVGVGEEFLIRCNKFGQQEALWGLDGAKFCTVGCVDNYSAIRGHSFDGVRYWQYWDDCGGAFVDFAHHARNHAGWCERSGAVVD